MVADIYPWAMVIPFNLFDINFSPFLWSFDFPTLQSVNKGYILILVVDVLDFAIVYDCYRFFCISN